MSQSKRSEEPDPRRGSYPRIYAVVRRIPVGRVATYGQVAELAGLPGHARQVGYALHAIGRSRGGSGSDPLEIAAEFPWHRVINARGEISVRSDPDSHAEPIQRILLEGEGVVFDLGGRTDLARFQWRPRRRGR